MAGNTLWPTALTIAGSDSGGGAGIQADLKTFASLKVHGTAVITCVTAQNPRAVRAIHPLRPEIIRQQIETVLEGFEPAAIKTGMLFSSRIIGTVARSLAGLKTPIIVDPVVAASSGAALLEPAAVRQLASKLLPLATLATPNIPEAELLLSRPIRTRGQLRDAAREWHRRFGRAVLIKGGHLRGAAAACDLFFDGAEEIVLSAPFIRGIRTHGTGCTLSAAIAAWLARGKALREAVLAAKEFISRAIAASYRAGPGGSHAVLNSFWSRQ